MIQRNGKPQPYHHQPKRNWKLCNRNSKNSGYLKYPLSGCEFV